MRFRGKFFVHFEGFANRLRRHAVVPVVSLRFLVKLLQFLQPSEQGFPARFGTKFEGNVGYAALQGDLAAEVLINIRI